jgi:hypothetical protein
MSVAQDGWFISDGIHYTPAGYAARAHLIARALERAFPVPVSPPAASSTDRPGRASRRPIL